MLGLPFLAGIAVSDADSLRAACAGAGWRVLYAVLLDALPASSVRPLLAVLLLLLAGSSLAASPIILNVIGDTGDCELPGTVQVSAAMRRQVDFKEIQLIEVGDLAYPVATRERLLECHEPYFSMFPRRLAVPGNHDWADSNAAGFFSIFPKPVPRIEDLGGHWRLLLLDSNLKGVAWARQMLWLDGMLGSSRDECLIAAWHHPRWSSGKHGDRRFVDPLWRRVSNYVSFTLHGHDHHFEALPQFDADGATSAQGTASFVVGTGGARHYEAGDSSRSARALYGKHGFLRIALDGWRYHWRFIGVDDKVLSSGSGICLPTGRRPYQPVGAPIEAPRLRYPERLGDRDDR